MRIGRRLAQPAGWIRVVAFLAGGVSGCAVVAAPLDALLTAAPERVTAPRQVDLSLQRVNRALAFATSAEDPAADPADPAALPVGGGSYQALQLQGSWQAMERLWLTVALSERRIGNAVDTFRYRGWQVSGQWRLKAADGHWPTLAARLSAWGNQASETVATTPVRVPGAILDTVTVTRPSDRNLQADLIGTWAISPSVDVSASLGVGVNRLAYGGLSATTTRNTCPYRLSFNGNDIFGELAGACADPGAVVLQQFYDSSGDYGVDVAPEIAWRGRFMQAGLNSSWHRGDWTLRGGYLWHRVQRQGVDDILAGRGAPVHRHNHTIAAEVAYRLQPQLSLYLGTQISTNLFMNDLPVTYNSSTSGNFGRRFSLYAIGLRAGF